MPGSNAAHDVAVARVSAVRLVRHLKVSGFVLMKRALFHVAPSIEGIGYDQVTKKCASFSTLTPTEGTI